MYTSLHYSITEISSEIMELPSTIQLTINSSDNDCKEKKIIEQPTMDDRSIVTDNVFSQFATSSATAGFNATAFSWLQVPLFGPVTNVKGDLDEAGRDLIVQKRRPR